MNVKVQFSTGVYKSITKNQVKREILQAIESEPEYRKEIARVFQVANRRIQNIEKAGVISPAVAALNKGDVQGYTKFSMKHDWAELKTEYAKAIAFLRQPTSTATGVKQYDAHLQKQFNLSKDEFNMMSKKLNNKLLSLSESDFVERYLMRYKDFTGELEQAAQDVSGQIESEATSIQRAIDNEIDNAAKEIADTTNKEIDIILKSFNDFGL